MYSAETHSYLDQLNNSTPVDHHLVFPGTGKQIGLLGIRGASVTPDITERILALAARVSDKLFTNNHHLNRIIIDGELFPEELGDQLPGNGTFYNGIIRVTHRAISQLSYRIKGVSSFEATLIHEAAEALLSYPGNQQFINDWALYFGFKGTLDADYPICTRPLWCVSDYAKSNARQDICDSLAAYYLNPQILYQGKLKLLGLAFNSTS